MITPPRIFDTKWRVVREAAGETPHHFDHLVKDYANLCEQIGVEKKLATINIYKLMENYGPNYGDLLHDGLHLSSLGSQLLFSALSPIVEKSIVPDLRFQFPYYRDLKEGQTKIDQ